MRGGGTNGRWAITRGRAIHILHVNSTLITPAVGNLLPCAPSVNFGDWVLEFKRSISAWYSGYASFLIHFTCEGIHKHNLTCKCKTFTCLLVQYENTCVRVINHRQLYENARKCKSIRWSTWNIVFLLKHSSDLQL